MSATAFADKIGVQPSNISHILSGRNKPSLEFVEKILMHYPNVSADWLIRGKTENTSSPTTEEGLPPTLSSTKKQIEKVVVFYTDHTFEEILK